MTTYAYSTNEELFTETVEAETIEDAANEALMELCLSAGERFSVGRKVTVHPEDYIESLRVLDAVSDCMLDELGDVADGWPKHATKAMVSELNNRLRDALVSWMTNTYNHPMFFTVEDVEEFTA